ncbi:MAG: hypothetical protein ACW981_06030 [Candidatus Hodarchaeales archaeon]|jgi:hypothetical protein
MSIPDNSLFQEKISFQRKLQEYLDNVTNEVKKLEIIDEIRKIFQYHYSKQGFFAIKFLLQILDSFLPDERKILISLFDSDKFSDIEGIKKFIQDKYSDELSLKSEKRIESQITPDISEARDESFDDQDLAPVEPAEEPVPELKPEPKLELEPVTTLDSTLLSEAVPQSEPEPISEIEESSFIEKEKAVPPPVLKSVPEPESISEIEESSFFEKEKADPPPTFKPEPKPEPAPPPAPKPSRKVAAPASVSSGAPLPPPTTALGGGPIDVVESKPAPQAFGDAKKKRSKGRTSERREALIKDESEFDEAELVDEDSFGKMDDTLEEPPQLDRYLLLDYFKQMNPYTVYAYHITISKKELAVKKKVSDAFTGEVREQVTEKFELVSEAPVIVDVSFPGCLVTPVIQKISALEDKKIISFFVTPIAKGDMKGKIKLSQEDKEIFKMDVKYKVINQRISKIFSVLGLGLAALPTGLEMLFGLEMNAELLRYLTEKLPQLQSMLTEPLLLIAEIGLGFSLLVLGGLFFWRYRGKRSSLSSEPF